MTYYATNQRKIIFIFGLMCTLIMSITVYGYENESFYLRIALLILFLLTILIKYSFTINEDKLIYQIVILNIPIYKKEMDLDQIKQIKFIRNGWAKKGAIIEVNKGLNIRIARFESNNVCAYLIDFANKHDITICKTKDYLILEKF